MKVILLDEIAGKGCEGDVVDVARGFAVNYLFPKKLAIEASSGNLKQLGSRRANIEKRETTRRTSAEAIAVQLDGKVITIEAKAGEEGRLFGSVTSSMIQDVILDQLSVEVDRKKMDVGGHIKEIGEHAVAIRISHGVKATLTVKVTPEGGELEERASFLQDTEKAVAQVEEVEAAEAEAAEAEAAEAEDEMVEDAGEEIEEEIEEEAKE